MAARRKQGKARARTAGSRGSGASAALIENVQQIWLAGMGAIARAQKEGPAAFTEAVSEGFKLLERSRSNAEQAIRDAFEAAQESVQTSFGSARDQATETWDNLEALFQKRVHKALQQIGVPTSAEIELLTRRVAELSAAVTALERRLPKPQRGTTRSATKRRRRT